MDLIFSLQMLFLILFQENFLELNIKALGGPACPPGPLNVPPLLRRTVWHMTSVNQHLSPPKILSVWCYFFTFSLKFFWGLYHTACRILVPRLGIDPVAPVMKAQSFNHLTTREMSLLYLFTLRHVHTDNHRG